MFARYIGRLRKPRSLYKYYMETNKCVFIHIPKAAGSSILVALGKKEPRGRVHLPWHAYDSADPDKFSRYYKFSFVRDPRTRLVSAYQYLLEGGNRRKVDLKTQKVVARYSCFDAFVQEGLSQGVLLDHILFRPQTWFIVREDGSLAVDFLGHYESLREDFNVVAEAIGIENSLPWTNASSSKTVNYQSRSTLNIVESLFREDMEYFGY